MAANQIDIGPQTDALLTLASRTASFDVTMSHEPRKAPGSGFTFACWINQMDPVARASGLNVTSIRIEWMVRLFMPYVGPNADELNNMDRDMSLRVGMLFAAFSGDFEITPQNHTIDLLGAYGEPLRMRAGFATFEKTPFRIADVLVPVILFDVFDQSSEG